MDKPKRYALFAWNKWEPSGGIGDLVDTFDSVEEAKQSPGCQPHPIHDREVEIIDLTTLEEVESFEVKAQERN